MSNFNFWEKRDIKMRFEKEKWLTLSSWSSYSKFGQTGILFSAEKVEMREREREKGERYEIEGKKDRGKYKIQNKETERGDREKGCKERNR